MSVAPTSPSSLEGSGFELVVKEGSEAWVVEDGEDDVTGPLHASRANLQSAARSAWVADRSH